MVAFGGELLLTSTWTSSTVCDVKLVRMIRMQNGNLGLSASSARMRVETKARSFTTCIKLAYATVLVTYIPEL
jgi:hypothetical protein